MTREQQEKLIPNIKGALEPVATKYNWDEWKKLYSIDEQSARLLHMYLRTTTPPKYPIEIPAEILAEYEDRLQTWLSEHPFLRDREDIGNAVFESFLIAQALVKDVGGLRASLESKLRSARHKPNPLMAEFYFELARPDHLIRVEHVGFVYDSLLSGLQDSSRMMFSFSGGDVSDECLETSADVEFDFVDESGDELRSSIGGLVDVDITSQLCFARYLKDAEIDTGIEVVLGGGSGEYELGPRVSIECAALNLHADALVVTGSRSELEPDDFGVVLIAGECESRVTVQPRVHTSLRVDWPGSEVFPWAKYAARAPIPQGPGWAEAFRRFRRIVLTLRSHKKGSLARVRHKIESQRVLGTGVGPRILDRLLTDGLLRLEGKFYHWVPDRADQMVGTTWSQLRRGQTSDRLWEYLTAIVDDG